MQYLIIDINHGALDLAKEYVNLDYNISVWDIYGKLEKNRDFLNNNLKNTNYPIENINLISSKEKPDFEKYDKIIAPIHCPIDYEFISFHDAVSELINEKYGNIHKKFIEITGVKGKTTTTELINYILKDKYNIFLNNSNKGSITPVSVLTHINNLNETDKLDTYDLFIFEVSLGITKCKYGAITNVLENYSIGGCRRDALTAKLSTLKNVDNKYINKSILDECNNFIKNNSSLHNLTIINLKNVKVMSKYPLKYKYNNKTIEFGKYVFGTHYIEDSLFALNICKNFVDYDYIIDKMKTFKIKNRMNIEKINNKYLIENINPGLDVKSIDCAINDFIDVFDSGVILIGGDLGCTCEEIDVKKLLNVIEKYRCNKYKNKNIKFMFVGILGKELKKHIDYSHIADTNIIAKYNENVLIIYRKSINYKL